MNKQSLLIYKFVLIALIALPCEGQSLWKDTSVAVTADKKAQKVGDILTVLVQENATATKDNSTQTAKSTGADIGISSFLYGPAASGLLTKGGQYPALKFNAKTDFEGGGKINNSEVIVARIAVRVIDVLPNGNLIVEGSRHTSFSGESQDAILRGSVRIDDITANNTIYSYNVADATIKYVSKGTVSNVQKKGWFTRFFDKVNPF
jgi:flagellar L-ring protein precursor FlgH